MQQCALFCLECTIWHSNKHLNTLLLLLNPKFSTHKRQLSVSLQQTCFGSFCFRQCYGNLDNGMYIYIKINDNSYSDWDNRIV